MKAMWESHTLGCPIISWSWNKEQSKFTKHFELKYPVISIQYSVLDYQEQLYHQKIAQKMKRQLKYMNNKKEQVKSGPTSVIEFQKYISDIFFAW